MKTQHSQKKQKQKQKTNKTTEHTYFSSAHGTFSRTDHILGHKSSLGKFKKTEIVSSIFSNHNTVRLHINYRKKTVKNTSTWRLNNTLLNNQEIIEEKRDEKIVSEITRFNDEYKKIDFLDKDIPVGTISIPNGDIKKIEFYVDKDFKYTIKITDKIKFVIDRKSVV